MARISKTSADVRAALAARFTAPEWSIMWEVSNGTGAAGGHRYADAVAMSLWPSRGLELWGMEIKVSRADWKREAEDPTKAELIASYCDRWFIVTTPGVIQDISEIPPAWGWLEAGEKGIIQRKDATKTEAKPCDRRFLAALLRRAGGLDEGRLQVELDARDRDRAETYAKRVQDEVRERMSRQGDLQAVVEKFQAASGIDLGSHGFGINVWASPDELGAIVNVLMNSNRLSIYGNMSEAAGRLRKAADELDQAAGLIRRESPHRADA